MRKKPRQFEQFEARWRRQKKVQRALYALDARLYSWEWTELRTLRGEDGAVQSWRWVLPPEGVDELELLAWEGKRAAREKELLRKHRRFRKLKRQAKRLNCDFEEYVLWRASSLIPYRRGVLGRKA